MANKWIALNLLLLIAVVGLGRELYRHYDQFKAKTDPAKIEPVSVENQAAAKTAPGISIDTSMEARGDTDADYFIISEKTLFSNLRGSEEELLPVAAKVAPLPNPKPVLVGTIMVDGEYVASVMNMIAQQQARNTQPAPETWRVGDFYRGYQVTSIEAEQLVLESGGMREVIPLNRTARRTPVANPVANTSAQVIPIGPGGGSSGAMTVSSAAASAPGRGATQQSAAARQAQVQQATQQATQQAAAQQAAAKQAAAQQAAAQLAAQQAAQQQRNNVQNSDAIVTQPEAVFYPAQSAQPAQKAQSGTGVQSQRTQPQQRVVRSPFGEVVRPGSE